MRFTEAEFDMMVEDLLCGTPPTFVPLYTVAEKTVKPYLCGLVRQNGYLRGGGHEEDVFQNTVIRLVKVTVTGFLLRNGPEGAVNRDPEGFEDWMFAIARNIYNDYVREFARHGVAVNHDSEMIVGQTDGEEPMDAVIEEETQTATEQRLSLAFSAVLDSGRGVYMVLAWMAQSLCVLLSDRRRLDANRYLVEKFSHMTLDQMYRVVMKAAAKLPWLRISKEQKNKIEEKLRKTARDGVTYGEIPFGEFYMTDKNGAQNGKKSISDWVNRLDEVVAKRLSADS